MTEDAGALGLNEHHEKELVQFLRWSRNQRGLRLRTVGAAMDDTRKSRLSDSTFTRDEVLDMLKGLEEVLSAELESELINTAHTSLLLLRQMCGQAEQWHLKLSANLSELENAELLQAVGVFEEANFALSHSKPRPQISVLKRLAPIEGGGAAPLLQQKIGELAEENRRLKDKLRNVSEQAAGVAGEKARLGKTLGALEEKLQAAAVEGNPVQAVGDLESKMMSLKTELGQDLAKSKMDQATLAASLTEAHKRFLEVREQLEMTEKELEVKFSSTGAYRNLKSMLGKKNGQLKELRSRLAQYEPPDAAED